MIRQPNVALLREMRLSAMAAELERQTADEESYRELFFEDLLAMLVDAEWSRRQSNKFARCLRNVRFAIPSATVEGIEYHADRKLNKKQMLQFASCRYIESGHHIIFKGASGNGKAYLACALGESACRNCTVYGISACWNCLKR